MTATVGRIVHYRLTAEDARKIKERRVRFGMMDSWPVQAGDVYPMIVTWLAVTGDRVNGQVFLNGTDTLWVRDVREAYVEPGCWFWPPLEAARAETDPSVRLQRAEMERQDRVAAQASTPLVSNRASTFGSVEGIGFDDTVSIRETALRLAINTFPHRAPVDDVLQVAGSFENFLWTGLCAPPLPEGEQRAQPMTGGTPGNVGGGGVFNDGMGPPSRLSK